LRVFAFGKGGFEKHLVRRAEKVLKAFCLQNKRLLVDPCVVEAVAVLRNLGLTAEVVAASGEADVCCRQLGERTFKELSAHEGGKSPYEEQLARQRYTAIESEVLPRLRGWCEFVDRTMTSKR